MDQHVPEPPDSPRLFRPRGVGEILSHAFHIYVRNWTTLVPLVAVIVIPLSIVQVVFTDVVVDDLAVRETATGELVVEGGSLAAALLGGLVVGLLSVLMWTILTGAITRAAAATFLGRNLDLGESYRFGLSRFWSIVLVGILTGLAVVAGFLLLVIPGFIVLTRLTCTLPALVIEDRRGRSALKRSWNLVAGRGWPVFGTIFVAGLMTGLLGSVLTGPFEENLVLRIVAQSLSSVITMPYTALVGILIYLDLRVRKERYGPDELEADLARSAAG
jgi:hypothetical protein